jgi:hypothetical protein
VASEGIGDLHLEGYPMPLTLVDLSAAINGVGRVRPRDRKKC